MRRRTFLTVAGCVVGAAGCLRLDGDSSTATESGTETETPDEPTTATPTDEGAGTEVEAWNRTYGEGPVWRVISADGGYVFASQSAYADSGGGGQLVKTDRDGTVEWERTYGGQELDALYAVVDTGDGYLAAGQTGDSDSVESWLVETDTDGMLGQERTYGSGALYSLSQTASGAFLAAGGSMVTSADTGDGRLLRQGAIEA